MRVGIVLGKKPRKGEAIHPELRARALKASYLLRAKKVDLIIVSGGKTRGGMGDTEAGSVYNLFPSYLRERMAVRRESFALSTAQNIEYSKKMLQATPVDELVILTSPYHVRRTRFLLAKIWPEMLGKTTFLPVGPSPFKEVVVEAILLALLFVDPKGKWIFPLLHKVFRNA